MPFEPVRFLHAADVRIDHPVRMPGPLSPRLAAVGQRATIDAFERLISTAIERSVDFLLLAGNTFIESDRSLAGRLAMLDGFQRLAEEAIRVFAMPGPLDPADAWRLIPGLPKNVLLLDANQKSAYPLK